jgi:hypothetical protein
MSRQPAKQAQPRAPMPIEAMHHISNYQDRENDKKKAELSLAELMNSIRQQQIVD